MEHVSRTIAAYLQLKDGEIGQSLNVAGQAEALAAMSDDDLAALLEGIVKQPSPEIGSPQEAWLNQMATRIENRFHNPGNQLTPQLVNAIASCYQHHAAESKSRYGWLAIFSNDLSQASVGQLVKLLVADPPQGDDEAARCLAPLFRKGYDPAWLFPALFDALAHRQLAAAVVDLSNYVAREGLADTHPGFERREELAALLSDLVHRLATLQATPPSERTADHTQSVGQTLPLVVSLCDSLGLIGDSSLAGKLHQALDLGHRRVHTEAAAALARLGVEAGQTALAEMTKEPVARLRAITYLEELELAEHIPEEARTSQAIAEAELVSWLADTRQFGIPPQVCELLDTRSLFWPGYDDTVECFLFRYTYTTGVEEISGIGLAGPATQTTLVDVTGIETFDLYALFAGEDAQHADIREIPPTSLDAQGHRELERLLSGLQSQEIENVQPVWLGIFFERRVAIAKATRIGLAGVVVYDGERTDWYPSTSPRSPGAREAYAIYKGRELLQTFNA